MKAKENRDDLSLWDVRKPSLYGSALASVQAQLFIGQLRLFIKGLCQYISASSPASEQQKASPGSVLATDFWLG